jgi:hypothetical protein
MSQVADTPKAAAERFIAEDLEDYRDWYEAAAKRNYYFWSGAQCLSIAAGFLTAVLAALLPLPQFASSNAAHVALVLLPLIGALASTYLVQSRIGQLLALRENGRIAVERLKASARTRFAAARQPEDYTRLHESLAEELSALEQNQAKTFFTVVPQQMNFDAPTRAGRRRP